MRSLFCLSLLLLPLLKTEASLCSICVLPILKDMEATITFKCSEVCQLIWPEGRPTREERAEWYNAVGRPDSLCYQCAIPLKAESFVSAVQNCSTVCSRGRIFFEFHPDPN